MADLYTNGPPDHETTHNAPQLLTHLEWCLEFAKKTETSLTSMYPLISKHTKNGSAKFRKIKKGVTKFVLTNDFPKYEKSVQDFTLIYRHFIKFDLSYKIDPLEEFIEKSKFCRGGVTSSVKKEIHGIEIILEYIEWFFSMNDSMELISYLNGAINNIKNENGFNTEPQRISTIVSSFKWMERVTKTLYSGSSDILRRLNWAGDYFNCIYKMLSEDISKHNFPIVTYELKEVVFNSDFKTDAEEALKLVSLFGNMETRAIILNNKTKNFLTDLEHARSHITSLRSIIKTVWMKRVSDLNEEVEKIVNQYYTTCLPENPGSYFYYDPRQPYTDNFYYQAQEHIEDQTYEPFEQYDASSLYYR